MGDPFSWGAGYAGKKALDWMVSKGAEENLSTRLKEVVRAWAKSLPPELYLVPDSLFPDVQPADLAPGVQAVRARLLRDELPTVAEWEGLIHARRESLRKTIPLKDLERFFAGPESPEYHAAVHDLAVRIDRECVQEERLFKGQTIAMLAKLIQQSESAHQRLHWAEQHVVMTLGVSPDGAPRDFETAKLMKLKNFSETLLDGESLIQLLVLHAEVLGIPVKDALGLWMRDAFRLPERMTPSIALLGWRFEAGDPNVEFIGAEGKTPTREAQDFTRGLVDSFRSLFPGGKLVVICNEDPGPGTTLFEILRGGTALLDRSGVDALINPFTGPLSRDGVLERLNEILTEKRIIPVVVASPLFRDAFETTAHCLSVTSSIAQLDRDVVCLPVGEVSGNQVIANDVVACVVAAGMAAQLIKVVPGASATDVIKAVVQSRALHSSIPSYEGAHELLQSAQSKMAATATADPGTKKS